MCGCFARLLLARLGGPRNVLDTSRNGHARAATDDLSATSDAVVIGADHNGLVATILLAKAGWSVTVLERNDVVLRRQ